MCAKYACTSRESNGENPCIRAASKLETAIDKGLAGPGLLAYIVTSKFADYLPLYRLEDIFQRQGFELSPAAQRVWCDDVADLVEPVYELMAEHVRSGATAHGNSTRTRRGSGGAAARIGLSRTTLISRMKKLGINPYDYA